MGANMAGRPLLVITDKNRTYLSLETYLLHFPPFLSCISFVSSQRAIEVER